MQTQQLIGLILFWMCLGGALASMGIISTTVSSKWARVLVVIAIMLICPLIVGAALTWKAATNIMRR